jgi:hypothetical protein
LLHYSSDSVEQQFVIEPNDDAPVGLLCRIV